MKKKGLVSVFKRITAVALSGLMLISLAACSDGNSSEEETKVPVSVTLTDDDLETYYKYTISSRTSVHDPSIVVGTDEAGEKCYYIFGSHLAFAKSYDLVKWTNFTNNLTTNYETIFADSFAWSATGDPGYSPSGNMWAPDVLYNEELGKWCMYMSINGRDWNSTICLLTADTLYGDWEYQGIVIYSGFGTDEQDYTLTDYTEVTGDTELDSRYAPGSDWSPNYGAHAIDPCVFYDEDGNLLMAYGSWSGGTYVIDLDESTGFRDKAVTYEYERNVSDPYMGVKLGGSSASGEGVYIRYIDGYYYMFLSYGGLTANGGYNMRVFRSEDVKGKYADVSGNLALEGGGIQGVVGTRLMTYYKWSYKQTGETAQGHNSVLVDDDGKAYVIYHARTDNGTESHSVRVHELFTTKNGYLVAAPFEYRTTDEQKDSYTKDDVLGKYQVILHTNTNFGSLECVESSELILNSDGTLSGAYEGTWELEDGTNYINFTIADLKYEAVICEQTMEGTNVETLCFTGVGESDLCFWGAKYPSDESSVAWAVTNFKAANASPVPASASGNITFPTISLWDVDVEWTSSNTDIIANDGTFTAPSEDTDVTITVTFTKDSCQYKAEYTVKALAK